MLSKSDLSADRMHMGILFSLNGGGGWYPLAQPMIIAMFSFCMAIMFCWNSMFCTCMVVMLLTNCITIWAMVLVAVPLPRPGTWSWSAGGICSGVMTTGGGRPAAGTGGGVNAGIGPGCLPAMPAGSPANAVPLSANHLSSCTHYKHTVNVVCALLLRRVLELIHIYIHIFINVYMYI